MFLLIYKIQKGLYGGKMERVTNKNVNSEKENFKLLSFPKIKSCMPKISAKLPVLNLNALNILLDANLIPA